MKKISVWYSFAILSTLTICLFNNMHGNYEAIDALYQAEQQHELNSEIEELKRKTKLETEAKYLLEDVNPCKDFMLLSVFNQIKHNMKIKPSHEIGLNINLISPTKRLSCNSLDSYALSRMDTKNLKKYDEDVKKTAYCEYTYTPRAKESLNRPNESINLNSPVFNNALPSTKIRILYETVHEAKQKNPTNQYGAYSYRLTENEEYYHRELEAANHINCPECLTQWKETSAPATQNAHPLLHDKHISKETLETIIKSKPSKQYCAAHANIPVTCWHYALMKKISPSEENFQKFEKCLRQPLEAYLP